MIIWKKADGGKGWWLQVWLIAGWAAVWIPKSGKGWRWFSPWSYRKARSRLTRGSARAEPGKRSTEALEAPESGKERIWRALSFALGFGYAGWYECRSLRCFWIGRWSDLGPCETDCPWCGMAVASADGIG